MLRVLDEGRSVGLRHYLLGSTGEALQSLSSELTRRFPGVVIVGMESPPFGSMTCEQIRQQDEAIVQSGASIVWVGLGTPKQDFEVHRLAHALPVTAVAVGAAFDFLAGNKKESPKWMRSLSLEWAFRLWSEPRRLWRRYLFGNLRFLWILVRDVAGRRAACD